MSTFFSDMNQVVQKCIAIFTGSDISNQITTLDLSSNKETTTEEQSKETSKILKCEDNNTQNNEKFGILSMLYKRYPKTMLGILILHVLISVCAMVLAWECNRMTNPIMRLIVTVVATIFSEIYIIYYAIYHIIMGFQCYVLTPTVSTTNSVSLPPL